MMTCYRPDCDIREPHVHYTQLLNGAVLTITERACPICEGVVCSWNSAQWGRELWLCAWMTAAQDAARSWGHCCLEGLAAPLSSQHWQHEWDAYPKPPRRRP